MATCAGVQYVSGLFFVRLLLNQALQILSQVFRSQAENHGSPSAASSVDAAEARLHAGWQPSPQQASAARPAQLVLGVISTDKPCLLLKVDNRKLFRTPGNVHTRAPLTLSSSVSKPHFLIKHGPVLETHK